MATERTTIEVQGVRVSCDRCGATLAEGEDIERAEGAAMHDGAWHLVGPKAMGNLWLCKPCGEAVHAHISSDRAAVERRKAAAS